MRHRRILPKRLPTTPPGSRPPTPPRTRNKLTKRRPDWKTAKHIVLDFDGTITTEDTIENIAQAAIEWGKTPEGGHVDRTAAWQRIKDIYARDLAKYREHSDAWRRKDWHRELQYLNGLRKIELRSTQRVKDSGIFKGFTQDASRLYNAGMKDVRDGRVKLQRGFEQLIQDLNKLPGPVQLHIVSLNWSVSYIRGVLGPQAVSAISTIIANEIDAGGAIRPCTATEMGAEGPVGGIPLLTGEDKALAVDNIVRRLHGVCDLYIGDSLGDLACLRAFRGIAIAGGEGHQPGDTALMNALHRVQGPVYHILDIRKESNYKTAKARWTQDFEDVVVYLKELYGYEFTS